MDYIETFKKNLKEAEQKETMPIVNNGDKTTITYKRKYKGGEGNRKLVFYYKIDPSVQTYFNNCHKTFVELTFDADIDIELYKKRIVPQEIVANIFGYPTYSDLYKNIDGIPENQQKQIQEMVVSLIPITKQEFSVL